jgi:hypothetical protein
VGLFRSCARFVLRVDQRVGSAICNKMCQISLTIMKDKATSEM